MKKLISAFLILTVLLVCLAGAAMAAAPTIGEMTVSDEGFVTLAATGENINCIGVTFYGEDGNWAGRVDLNLNEETGLYEGTNYYYDPANPYATAEYRVLAETENTYDSATKTSKNKNKQYSYDQDRKLTGWNEYSSTDTNIGSDDGKTQTWVYESSNIDYDASGKTVHASSTREEAVGKLVEWQVDERSYSDYATETTKREITETNYSASGETFTTKTVENYKVELIDKTPDAEWIDDFYPDSYTMNGYKLISGEKTKTEKGTKTEKNGDVQTVTTADTKTDYTIAEGTDENYPDQTVLLVEEGKKTGTEKITQTGSQDVTSSEYDQEAGKWKEIVTGRLDINDTTTYTYNEDGTRTVSQKSGNKEYDLDNKLIRADKRDTTTEEEYVSYEHTETYSDGSEYRSTVKGYAARAFRGTQGYEIYENGKLSEKQDGEYDLTVHMKERSRWVPEFYLNSNEYKTISGTQKEKHQRNEEYGSSPSRTESTSESETVFQDAKNKVVHEVQTDRDVIKATGAVRSEDVRDSTTHYEFSAYTAKFSSQEQNQEGWHAAAEESKRTQKVYDVDTGVLTGDNESTSKTEYDFVKYTYGENNEYYDYQSRIATDTTDYVNRSFSSDTGLRTIVDTGYSRKKVTGDTLEEKFGSEQLNYDGSTGSYIGKYISETVRTQKKGEDDYAASPFSWPVETSNTVMKQYNAKDALIYEMNEVMANGVTKENRTNYTNKGKVSSTYIKEEDNNKGTRYSDQKDYNTYTGAVQSETRRDATKGEDGRWQETSSYTYNNDDGSLRSAMVRHPDGSEEHYRCVLQEPHRRDPELSYDREDGQGVRFRGVPGRQEGQRAKDCL